MNGPKIQFYIQWTEGSWRRGHRKGMVWADGWTWVNKFGRGLTLRIGPFFFAAEYLPEVQP